MGPSSKLFLLSADDTLHLLANAPFMRMLRHEPLARIPDFAGQRVRQASVVVELVNGTPSRMVRCTFGILDIDGDGMLDVERWSSQQFARVDDPLAPHPPGLVAGGGRIIDASSRFVERGGSWEPDQLYSAASRRRRWANYPVHGCGWFVESPGASLVHIKLLVAGG